VGTAFTQERKIPKRANAGTWEHFLLYQPQKNTSALCSFLNTIKNGTNFFLHERSQQKYKQ
jgi:hypothetical protein